MSEIRPATKDLEAQAAAYAAADAHRFRKMSDASYRDLDDSTKENFIRAKHRSLLQQSYEEIGKQLDQISAAQPNRTLTSLAAMLVHRDDPLAAEPIAPGMPSIRELLARGRLEVLVQVVDRLVLAQQLAQYPDTDTPEDQRPYADAARHLSQEPPEGSFVAATFTDGRCTIQVILPNPPDDAG